MRIKLGDTYFDSLKEPIMIIFDEGEQELISKMKGDKYCSYPQGYSVKVIEEFMKVEE